VDEILVLAELADELDDALLVVEDRLALGVAALVDELDGDAGVEEGELAEAGGEVVEIEIDPGGEDRRSGRKLIFVPVRVGSSRCR
jgi:hypothetical protein